MKPPIIPLVMTAMLVACQTVDETPSGRLGQATLQYADGSPAGSARLLRRSNEVNLSVSLIGTPDGVLSVHLHTIGSCRPPDFTSAGAPLALRAVNAPHSPQLPHVPASVIGASGAGTFSVMLAETPAEIMAQVFDKDGSVIVIHVAGHHDRADRAVEPGERLACGIFSNE